MEHEIAEFDVYPSNNGTTIFEWEIGKTKICLEVGKTTYSYYISPPEEATQYGMGKLPDVAINENDS